MEKVDYKGTSIVRGWSKSNGRWHKTDDEKFVDYFALSDLTDEQIKRGTVRENGHIYSLERLANPLWIPVTPEEHTMLSLLVGAPVNIVQTGKSKPAIVRPIEHYAAKMHEAGLDGLTCRNRLQKHMSREYFKTYFSDFDFHEQAHRIRVVDRAIECVNSLPIISPYFIVDCRYAAPVRDNLYYWSLKVREYVLSIADDSELSEDLLEVPHFSKHWIDRQLENLENKE